ncbi:MAG: homoserine O-acetyltransferase MetX [Kiritimatiellia bacterium]
MNSDLKTVGVVETNLLKIPLPAEGFRLECGRYLPELTVAYETYGTLSPDQDNVVFICHALSGDAHVAGYHGTLGNEPGWWENMVGPGKGIDTNHYFVICANILGGCKGTTGPSSINPQTGKPYGIFFPPITVADIVEVHRLLLSNLGIKRVAAVIGGSFGGMQALEMALRYPDLVERCICIASAARLSTQALAFDIISRTAITQDPDWQTGNYVTSDRKPVRGLSLARKIGHVTYLSAEMLARKFGRERAPQSSTNGTATSIPTPEETPSLATLLSNFQVGNYLDYQGRKFVARFDANSYLYITLAMDEYDLYEKGGGSLEKALKPLRARLLVVALSSDWLFPPEQSIELANAMLSAGKRVSYCLLDAPHGHDAFLVDIENLAQVMRAFLPWVGVKNRGVSIPGLQPPPAETITSVSGKTATGRIQGKHTNRGFREEEYRKILEMIPRGARVLDLGCGDGELLSLLARERGTTGFGVDIELRNVIEVIDGGHDVFQADIDSGLSMIPDQTYDFAILSETLPVIRKPRAVLHEMLRVAREGIVTFPNFGNICHRVRLFFAGRIPRDRILPFEWYDSPQIHLFTMRDFLSLCREDGIGIREVICLADRLLDRLFLYCGLCNIGAQRVIVRITRDKIEQPRCGQLL